MEREHILLAVAVIVVLVAVALVFVLISSGPEEQCFGNNEEITDPNIKCCDEGASPKTMNNCLNEECTEVETVVECRLPPEGVD